MNLFLDTFYEKCVLIVSRALKLLNKFGLTTCIISPMIANEIFCTKDSNIPCRHRLYSHFFMKLHQEFRIKGTKCNKEYNQYLQFHLCKCLTQPNNSFQLPHSNWYCCSFSSFIRLLSHILYIYFSKNKK